MPLEKYWKKRDFGLTPEPAGGPPGGGTGRFVVQRHRATRLHYDFRLEIDGVLVSWAVPKGPTLDSTVRRMAVHVEDHPIEYFDFEGVIPAKQYGAGDVIVWDWGTWEPEPETPNPSKAIEDGELKFVLHGQKVRGRFTIVRTSRRPGSAPSTAFEDDSEQWLLIKKRDADASAGWDAEDFPQSVKTGRTNDEVKANRDAIWISEQPAAVAQIHLDGAVEAPMPDRIEPMSATLASKAFDDPDWLFEIKWDGYRVEAVVRDGKVKLWTRSLKDGEVYFPNLLSPPAWIDAREAIVDGEVVAIDEEGRPDFSLLQERISERRTGSGGGRGQGGPLVFQAFDLLYLDGRSLLKVPLEDRKRLLRSVVRETNRVRYASHVVGDGQAFMAAAGAQGLEGIVAKLRRSRYEPGRRTPAWLKLKIRPEQELVVGGWTPGEGNARDLGAVAVGVYEDGKLRFCGKVGSGFTAATRKRLLGLMEPLVVDKPAFDPPPPKDWRGRWGGDLNGITWIRPELVIRAEIGGWTRDGHVRQTSFKGVETGRDPATVVREEAVSSASAVREAEAAEPEPAELEPAEPVPGSGARSSRIGDDSAVATAKKTGKRSKKPDVPDGLRTTGPDGRPWVATPEELEALAEMAPEGVWRVGGRNGEDLKLTNLEKVLFEPHPIDGGGPVTKRELVRYFARIGPALLPHLAERPLNLHRFPNGAAGPGFWQKDTPDTVPSWIRRWKEVGVEDRKANVHVIADRVATLCWLGNQAAFEVHAWTSRLEEPFRPTFALIDIDPGSSTTWEETLVLARLYRTALDHLGVRAYPKVTGQRGIQAWIPIEPKYTFSDTSDWVERISRAIGSTVPDLVSWEWSKGNRGGKARLDYTQNQPIKTLVAPYSVRPAAGAPVSAPITWDELDDPDLRPNRWTVRTIVERVERVGDLFAGAQTDAQELPPLG
ncbi:MAG TPA: non-homologous end-joining DNA ligase [Candidatus Limnocylindrales bacterium]|nr:non-homologous end-joining DNA ligase [Candidatus Limnocylindrales bacterium]